MGPVYAVARIAALPDTSRPAQAGAGAANEDTTTAQEPDRTATGVATRGGWQRKRKLHGGGQAYVKLNEGSADPFQVLPGGAGATCDRTEFWTNAGAWTRCAACSVLDVPDRLAMAIRRWSSTVHQQRSLELAGSTYLPGRMQAQARVCA